MKYDVIVIGGGPAGVISAVTARNHYNDKSILLIKSVEHGVIPCGIPYMFSTLEKPEDNAMGNKPLEANKIDLKIGKVKHIDRHKKEIKVSDETISYEKLIIATGSTPIEPPIKGIEKKGIYHIEKEMGHLINLKKDIENATDVVIIGGGFIGVEFADEISTFEGKNVIVIEAMQEILANSFDSEFSSLAAEEIKKKGVNIITDKKVMEFKGGERVDSVLLSDGSEISCQIVILGIGAVPNSGIAKKADLEIGKSRGIIVDEYLRTGDPDIFAVGDCAEKKDFFTRKKIPVMLASTATAEARVAGANLFALKVIRENRGTIATYSTKIGELTLGSAGLTEKTAKAEGFEIVIGNAECPDKHPGKLPGTKKVKVKLVFSKQSDILLGGQVSGGESAGEMVNIIGLALQKVTSLTELDTLQIATHPKLTAAPTSYPIIKAAQDALKKCNRS